MPTPNVSLIDFKFLSKKDTTIDEINKTFIEAEKYSFNKIIQTTSNPLVSSDFNHNSNSSIVDLTETKVVNNKFCRILSWYDNEWGFSNRLVDLSLKLSK